MRWIWNTGVWMSSAMECLGCKSWPAPDATGRIADYLRLRSGFRVGQQGHQIALLVEPDEVVAAADMGRTDEDLRHRAAAGDLDHRVAFGGVQVDADFFDVLDAALLEQHLGTYAIRAHLRRVHLDL